MTTTTFWTTGIHTPEHNALRCGRNRHRIAVANPGSGGGEPKGATPA
jgi:hypothetical protein